MPIADFVFGRCNPICSADESRVPRYTAGTLRIDAYLQLLLALMALAAITLIATRPFSPQIQFDAIPTSSCDSNNHDIIAGYDMKLTNRGALPIWIAASSPTKPVFVHASGYTEKGHLAAVGLAKNFEIMGKECHWIRLDKMESTTITLGAAMKRPHLLGLLAQDWRGREAEAWSDSYTPPHL